MSENWQKSENIAAKIYGKKTPGSGSGDSKLDIIGLGDYQGFLIENKYTDKASLSLTQKMLAKAKAQAAAMGKIRHAIRVDFALEKRYIVIEEDLFIELCQNEWSTTA